MGFRRTRRKSRPNSNNKTNNKPSRKQNDRDTDDISIEGGKAEQKNPTSTKYQKSTRSTLQDCISDRVTHGTKPGSQPYLTAEEEKSLTTHLINAAKLGYGKTSKQNGSREKGTFRKEKYLMDGGQDLLSDSHNFPYVRQIPQLMSIWMPSVRNLFHNTLIYWSLQ